jgi:RimJ/RimL family protein N-acetyltransferase
MYQVVPESVGQLKRFFRVPPPNAPMLEAFFEGRAPGRAFVNDFRSPTACVVAMRYNFVFPAGAITAKFFEDTLQELRREQTLHVVWSDNARRPPHVPGGSEMIDRVEFRRRIDADRARLRAARAALLTAPRAEVRRIDEALLERCEWREEIARATGSLRDFLGHGIGFCLLVGDTVVSEAYASFWGIDRIEIATTTHPDHRRRGYAAAACAQLIETCEEIGFETYWSCDASNEPSLRLAHKLGYADPRSYRLLRYAQRAASVALG